MTRSLDDIYSYYKQALDLIPDTHPNRSEIKSLLMSQVNDELHDHYAYNVPDRRTG